MRMKTSWLMAAFIALGGWGVVACGDSDPVGGVLSLTLTVTPDQVLVGEQIEVVAAATGADLAGLIIDFGDGRVDSVAALGAVTQDVRITDHSYTTAGTYQVVARVEDNIRGSLVRTSAVRVRDP